MRVYGAEHDLPDGVVSMNRVAQGIVAEMCQVKRLRNMHAKGYQQSLIPEDEARRRQRLLARARRGDPRATALLQERYGVRLVMPGLVPAATSAPIVGEATPDNVHRDNADSPAERRCACGKPSKYKDGRCTSCYTRDWKRAHGARPRYHGPCVSCGERPGRSISRKCTRCQRREYWRQRGIQRAWKRATGSDRTIRQVRLELLGLEGTPSQAEALDLVQRCLQSLQEGRMLLERNPWVRRRGAA